MIERIKGKGTLQSPLGFIIWFYPRYILTKNNLQSPLGFINAIKVLKLAGGGYLQSPLGFIATAGGQLNIHEHRFLQSPLGFINSHSPRERGAFRSPFTLQSPLGFITPLIGWLWKGRELSHFNPLWVLLCNRGGGEMSHYYFHTSIPSGFY